MAHHNETGNLGEEMAAKYLIDKGYKILHRNWRHLHWETDIIAERNSRLHFIEVKTRRTKKFGHPEEDVSKKKIENLIGAAEEFLLQYPSWKLIQFDILSINIAKNKQPQFFFIEDVYLP
ncbi:MAG TPA: YraN family protein [Chitinophagaceae bacterium]|nr:YraN family protein [Chitinophagaceae bacterium]